MAQPRSEILSWAEQGRVAPAGLRRFLDRLLLFMGATMLVASVVFFFAYNWRELALRYRVREGRMKFATNAFFFEEGRAADYEAARFGEFRAAASGELLLRGLRDRNLQALGPAPR